MKTKSLEEIKAFNHAITSSVQKARSENSQELDAIFLKHSTPEVLTQPQAGKEAPIRER